MAVPISYYFFVEGLCVSLTSSFRALHDLVSGCMVLLHGVCNSLFLYGALPFSTTSPADGKIATPVPRDSCTPFCEAPILTKIRGPASNRLRGVVCRGGQVWPVKLSNQGLTERG